MIKDLDTLGDEPLGLFDVCIVGGGPAGLSIALELLDHGLTVCVAEGGGEHFEAATQALYEGESVGHPMVLTEGRYRVLGGAATEWGGRCTTLDAIDFERRDWIADSGWPITLDELRPFYERAKRLSNFRQAWGGQDEAEAHLGLTLPRLRSPDLETIVWRMAPPDLTPSLATFVPRGVYTPFNWATAYRDRLARDGNLLLLLHANCLRIDADGDGGRVRAVEVGSLDGARRLIEARRFVLAAGGIENARLLLDAPAQLRARVDAHGALGRYFMQHPRGPIATIDADPGTMRRLQRIYNHFWHPRWRGQRFATGFALSAEAQRRHKLLNASAFVSYHSDPSWEAAKRFADAVRARQFDRSAAKDAWRLITGLPSLIPNAARVLLTARTVVHAQPRADILMDCEQQPDRNSRIVLTEQRDALGMRRCRVDWRFSELERRTGRFLAEAIGGELERLGLGKVTPAAWLDEDVDMQPAMDSTYHFMGATRMSDDPRNGVVDANCRAYGVENLYLAGASIFPTAGHANPTLSIVALAVRLADHIRTRLSKPSAVRPAATPVPATTASAGRVLVTGASGFIGGWVCDALSRTSVGEVVAGVRNLGPYERLAARGVAQVRCDVFDRESLAEALRGVSVVVHCARDDGRAGNAAEAVRNILEVGTPLGLRRLIQFSSVAVYGSAGGEIDEDTAAVEPLYAYGADKRAAEDICRDWAQIHDVTIAAIRPALVYGPGGEEWTDRFIREIASGRLKRLGRRGEGTANLVYVRDLADFAAMLTTADLPRFSTYNIAGDEAPTFDAYFDALSIAIGNGPLPLASGSARIRKVRRLARRLARALAVRGGRVLPVAPLIRHLRPDLGDASEEAFAQRVRYRTDRAKAAGFVARTSLADGVVASAEEAIRSGLVH